MATSNYVLMDKILDSNGALIYDGKTTFLAGTKQITTVELNNTSHTVNVSAVSNIKRFAVVSSGEVSIVITINAVATTFVCDGYFALSTTNAFWADVDSIVITESNLEDITISVYMIGEKVVTA